MRRRLAITALLIMTTGALNATEKYWIVHEASLVVVGTLHPYPMFPWFDGWHINGTIDVDEVLFGNKPAGSIPYRGTCKYSTCSDWRGFLSRLPPYLKERGMWFLKPLDDRTWQPSVDLGYIDSRQRADYLGHIRR
jgi:hypothetical protein